MQIGPVNRFIAYPSVEEPTSHRNAQEPNLEQAADPYDLDVQVNSEPYDLKKEQPLTCACGLSRLCQTLNSCAGNCA